jgi:hypothetical protein
VNRRRVTGAFSFVQSGAPLLQIAGRINYFDEAPMTSLPQDEHKSRFTSGTAIVLYVAAIRIILYLIAGANYGYFRDELYYLACGEHPAWGYVDQPPLIAWITWLLQHTIGTSIWALRLLPALAGAASVICAGKLASELGGRRWANHQNYWIWGPRQYTGESMIVLGERNERNMQTKCASYSIVGNTKDPLSCPDEWGPIYHCLGFKWNLQEIWPKTKHWD